MTTITTVTSKGSALTNTEMDTNLSNLNTYKLEDVDTRSTVKPSLNLDFANSKVLDPRITFTRASIATYYDGKTTTLAEQNLFNYSQNFGQYWTLQGATVGSGIIAPDGTTTANSITSTSFALGTYTYRTDTLLPLTQYTVSVYCKNVNDSYYLITTYDGTNGSRQWFNLSTTSLATSATIGTGFNASSKIVSVGNGWYRCSMTFTTLSTTSITTFFSFCDTDATFGVTVGYVNYQWGAQMEQRAYATSYTPTTSTAITNYIPVLQTANNNVARFDNDPVTGEPRGLLVEEQRTNLALYSGDLTNSTYVKTNLTVTNSNICPDGSNAAGKLISTSGTYGFLYQTVSITNGYTYNYSMYLKAGELTTCRMSVVTGPNSAYVDINLSAGSVGTVVSSGMTSSAYILPMGNNWYKVCLAFISTSTSASCFLQSTAIGNGYSGFFAWGMQLESAMNGVWSPIVNNPLSYIPTTTASVTRGIDYAIMPFSNLANASWFNPIQGTFVATFNGGKENAQGYYGRVIGYMGTGGTMISVNGAPGIAVMYINDGSSTVLQTNPNITMWEQFWTVCSSYSIVSTSSQNFSITTGSAVSTSSKNYIYTGALTGISIGSNQCLNGRIKRVAYYPVQLNQTQMISLCS